MLEKAFNVNPDGDSQPSLTKIIVPEELKLKNMVIEVTGGGKQLFRNYYATQIKVILTEAYGELKVTDAKTGTP